MTNAECGMTKEAGLKSAWLLRPMKERVYLLWLVKFEYSVVRDGKLLHEETPWFEVLAPEGDYLKRVALGQMAGAGLLPASAEIENWRAELKTDVDGHAETGGIFKAA